MLLIFPLILHRAYYIGGFFNTRIEFDQFIAGDGITVEIRMPDCNRVIKGKINRRSAQSNGTARISGPGLRSGFQAEYQEGEEVAFTS